MKKIEIIERITDANGSISENILTSWEHKNQFIPEIIRFGELKIYLQERIVKKNDSDVHLSKYEYDILLFLAKSPGRIFGKEMVYDLVWNEPYSGDYNVVMRHICNIREKIEDDPGQPLYIQTVRGVKSLPIIMVLQRREFVMRRSLYFRSILFEIFGQILMYQFQLFYFLLKRNILSI